MKLLITEDGNTREHEPHAELGIMTIGRAEGNDIALPGEKAASRKHVTLERMAEGWKLVDQMSANGTAVNGEKVNFVYLKENDVVVIGRTRIQVTGIAPAAAAAPAKPASAKPAPAAPRPRAAAMAAAAPQRASPPWGIAVAAAAVLALGVAAFFMFNNSTPEQRPDDYTAQPGTADSRQAELTTDDKAAIAGAHEIAGQAKPVLERLAELDKLAAKYPAGRGVVSGAIEESRAALLRELGEEVKSRVAADCTLSGAEVDDGNYAAAIPRLMALEAWLAGDPSLKLVGRDFFATVKTLLQTAQGQNERFVKGANGQIADLRGAQKFDDARRVIDDVLARAWLDETDAALYRAEKIRADGTGGTAVARVDGAPKGPSILDKIKPTKDKPPQANALLPDGAASEKLLLDGLRKKVVLAAKAGKLTSNKFEYRGTAALIKDATDDRLTLEVAGRDKKTGEELPYRTKVLWKDVSSAEMLQLFDRTPDLASPDLLAVLIYAFDNGFIDEAGRRALALYKREHAWKQNIDLLIAQKRRIALPDGGFIEFEGSLIAPNERDSVQFDRRLREVLARFEKAAGSKDKKKRDEAEKAFKEIQDMGAGAVAPAIAVLDKFRKADMARAEAATGLLANDDTKMRALLTELDKRRKFALELIFDEEKYPYPYGPNQAEVQAEVNRRVAAVREIWNDPTAFTGQTNPEFDAILDRVRAIGEKMALLDPGQQHYTGTPDEDIDYIRTIANGKLNIQNYAPSEDKQRKALISLNRQIMETNEKFPTGEGHCDGDGREQTRITNEYRIMFGRVGLKINDKLFWAARHHSQYCVERNGGQIAHVIPGEPRGEGPGDRMRHEGYSGGGGENIHMNSGGPTALSSHNGWCHSSGHHRNILNSGWRALGSGHYMTIWTQNFGSTDEGEDNAKSNGGK